MSQKSGALQNPQGVLEKEKVFKPFSGLENMP